MKRPQISTSVSQRTRAQADQLLADRFATLSELLTVAIDRLYQSEPPSDTARLRAGATDVPCANCRKPIDPTSTWLPGTFDEAYCPACQE
jgi:hypothetical protein